MEPGKTPTYRFRAWNTHFECGRSTDIDSKSKGSIPTRQDGLGYMRFVSGEDGERLYGCFVAAVIVVHKQSKDVRAGWLTENGKSDGEPYTARDLGLMTHMSEDGMQKMLERCSEADIGWLERYEDGELTNKLPERKAPQVEGGDKIEACIRKIEREWKRFEKDPVKVAGDESAFWREQINALGKLLRTEVKGKKGGKK